MSREEIRHTINSLKTRYLVLQWLESMLLGFSFASLTYSLLSLFFIAGFVNLFTSLLVFLFLVIISAYRKDLFSFAQRDILAYLNAYYPSLQDSTDLLIGGSENLTHLQLLQQAKISTHFSAFYKTIRLPHTLGKTSVILLACLSSSALLFNAAPFYNEESSNNLSSSIKVVGNEVDSPYARIETLTIYTTPPAYTGIQAQYSSSTTLAAPEGSSTQWDVTFSTQCEAVNLIVSGMDTLDFDKKADRSYQLLYPLRQTGFYQLQWTSNGKTILSDFYKVEVVNDASPKIQIKNLEQFTELTLQETLTVNLETHLSDDYGLSNAQIIATVSKGSGESVKFREEKMRFKTPDSITGKQVRATTFFDLRKLGLEPGDELYFYVEAFDTKQPNANRSRTETYFIALQDTANLITSTDEGLGVDLMPEYFRSQRQIIIDTEKLLRNKKALSKEEFNFTSNALGYDQKVLRLRYSEFMGEEFVSGIGPEAVHEEEHGEEDDDDVVKAFGHVHDSENEHNLVEEKHDHGAEKDLDPDKKLSALEEFVHAHDDAEEATFYIQSVKAKLRAALTLMWDAELHLRLFEPQKSLPYQYKILNLLKEISNDSRIYVHRTGFDPPPIKEDKRYTADLQDIKNSTNRYEVEEEESVNGIREAVVLLQAIEQQDSPTLIEKQRLILSKAGQELARLSVDKPLLYLEGLRLLRILINDTIDSTQLPKVVRQTQVELLRAIPIKAISVDQKNVLLHPLDRSFINILDQQKND